LKPSAPSGTSARANRDAQKSPARTLESIPDDSKRWRPLDAALVAIAMTIALVLMSHSGSRRGEELMPWPDGLEYAATAVNLDSGTGPVLHFGGYSYPPRYTYGYPLLLAAAYPILGDRVERLYVATIATGLAAIAILYALTLWFFGRASAFAASAMLAMSPLFTTYSTLVLSDVPATAFASLAMMLFFEALRSAERGDDIAKLVAWWAGFGVTAGFAIIIRPTLAALFVGAVIALLIVPINLRAIGVRRMTFAVVALVAGVAIFPLWQMIENSRHLGHALANGYAFWVPEVYGESGRTFGLQFLFGPTAPRNPYGNVLIYALATAGLDGVLSSPGVRYFIVYPFAAAIFAAIGFAKALRVSDNQARRFIFFGLGFFAANLAIYLVYFFTEVAFVLPAMLVIFSAAGYGLVAANRTAVADISRRRSRGYSWTVAGVVGLDIVLAFSLAVQAGSRMAAPSQPSETIAFLHSIDSRLGTDSLIVSNGSLQFLDLYVGGRGREFVGLNSLDPGGRFTDYHLHRLYEKRAAGWNGAAPRVLFDGARPDDASVATVQNAMQSGRSVYFLMFRPETQDYADTLKTESDSLQARFTMEPIEESRTAVLFRLSPR